MPSYSNVEPSQQSSLVIANVNEYTQGRFNDLAEYLNEVQTQFQNQLTQVQGNLQS